MTVTSPSAPAGAAVPVPPPTIAANVRRLDNRLPVLAFSIRTHGQPWFEVLLTTDRALFDPAGAPRRTASNFYASRQDGGLARATAGETAYIVPAAVVKRFAEARPRPAEIFYTVAAFATPDGPPLFAQPPQTLALTAPSVLLGADFQAGTLAEVLAIPVEKLRPVLAPDAPPPDAYSAAAPELDDDGIPVGEASAWTSADEDEDAIAQAADAWAADPDAAALDEIVPGYDEAATNGNGVAAPYGAPYGELAEDEAPYDAAHEPGAVGYAEDEPYDEASAVGFADEEPYDEASAVGFADEEPYDEASAVGFADEEPHDEASAVAYAGDDEPYDEAAADEEPYDEATAVGYAEDEEPLTEGAAEPSGYGMAADDEPPGAGFAYDDGFGEAAGSAFPAGAPEPGPLEDADDRRVDEELRAAGAALANGAAPAAAPAQLDIPAKIAIVTKLGRLFESRDGYSGINPDREFRTPQLPQYNRWHVGLSFGFVQFTQDSGKLGQLLVAMRDRDPAAFARIFGADANELVRVTTLRGPSSRESPGGRSVRVQPVAGADLWQEPWLSRFRAAGAHPPFQAAQNELAVRSFLDPMLGFAAGFGLDTERALAMVVDRAIQMGVGGGRAWLARAIGPIRTDAERQQALGILGLPSVQEFQARNGLRPDGRFGPTTHAALVGALRRLGPSSPIPIPPREQLLDAIVARADAENVFWRRRPRTLRTSPELGDAPLAWTSPTAPVRR